MVALVRVRVRVRIRVRVRVRVRVDGGPHGGPHGPSVSSRTLRTEGEKCLVPCASTEH